MTTTPINPVTPVYRKLPGRARALFGLFVNERQRVWLGDDHLLVVTQAGYRERYKRFYLADIQALSIQKTAAGAVMNFVLLAFAALFGSLAITGFLNDWNPGAYIGLMLCSGFFIVATLINVAFGPTCQCHVLTAVHEELLFCLGRFYTAQRVVEYLRSIVESVQGATASEAAAEQAARAMRAAERRGEISPVRHESGLLHRSAFYLMLVNAVLSGAAIANREMVPLAVLLFADVLLIGVVLAALIRQRDSDIPRSIRSTIWAAFIFNGLMSFLILYLLAVMQYMQQRAGAEVEPVAQDIRSGLGYASAGFCLVLNAIMGGIGLYYFRMWRRAAQAGASAAAAVASESAGAGE